MFNVLGVAALATAAISASQRFAAVRKCNNYYPRKSNEGPTIRSVTLRCLRSWHKTGRAAATGGRRTEGICIPLDHFIPAPFLPVHALKEEMQAMPDSTSIKQNEEAHWRKTSRLMFTHLGIWFFFGFVVHMFVKPLNNIIIPILGFPLGFYMAAQGSLIAFVVMLFMFAKQQDKIDREFGFAEED
jgi:putative solute:sodium symporter small subunit